jgi:L-histidine N-alpha-methyltransferase
VTPRETLYREVVRGLQATPRRLPAKLFYDARGAELFEAITRLPEYYPTRTELGILDRCLPEVAQRVGPGARVVEFGSGSGEKTARLLEALEDPAELVLLDISVEQLLDVARAFEARYPGLRVTPVAADYTLPWKLPQPAMAGASGSTPASGASPGSSSGTAPGSAHGTAPDSSHGEVPGPSGRTLFFFPGSTLGNFEPHEARGFLAHMALAAGRDAALLLGVDRVKPREILEPAYNDAAGVTAAFNRNALQHLNHVLGGDFDPDAFAHEAPWSPKDSRIEMRLVSLERQEVLLDPGIEGEAPLRFELAPGEAIVTEHSYKFTPERIEGLTRSAGWRTAASWTDEHAWFDVRLLLR